MQTSLNSYGVEYPNFILVLFGDNRSLRFSVRSFGYAPFLYADRGIYEQEYSKKAIDITGIELMPVEPNVCLGNGEHGFECCCEECDYCLFCFPELDKKTK